MPRTEPAPTWPLPTSWKIDFGANPAWCSALRTRGSAVRRGPCGVPSRTAAPVRATARRRVRRPPRPRRSSSTRVRTRTTSAHRTRSRSRRRRFREATRRARSPARASDRRRPRCRLSSATAVQMARRCAPRSLAPDQSMATTPLVFPPAPPRRKSTFRGVAEGTRVGSARPREGLPPRPRGRRHRRRGRTWASASRCSGPTARARPRRC